MRLPKTMTAALLLVASLGVAGPAAAWEMRGTQAIVLHGRDGGQIQIGTVTFTPQGARTGVSLALDTDKFQDFFLSMKEFKCLPTPDEVFCHVPYPYPNPASVTVDDLAWLEHALLFFYKLPSEFGAKLWNGVYYRLTPTDAGLVGQPQAVDLNQIGAPPADADTPPYGPAERGDIAPEARWFGKLTIQ